MLIFQLLLHYSSSFHNTKKFFDQTGGGPGKPHKFHYDLPIAVFNSNANHMGLDKWARNLSDNLVHMSTIKFTKRPTMRYLPIQIS